MQYKIPQNVGIEDKIVGPLSLRQLIIIFAGGGISYTIFAIASRFYELNALEYLVIGLPTLIALAAALIRIHNVSFTKYILLLLEFSINPKKRMWDHRGISNIVDPDLNQKGKAKTSTKNTEVESSRKNLNLKDLSATLDSGGFTHVKEITHKDIDAVADDDLITEAYFGNKREESSTGNMYWRTREVQKKKLQILADIEAKQKLKGNASETVIQMEQTTQVIKQTEKQPEKDKTSTIIAKPIENPFREQVISIPETPKTTEKPLPKAQMSNTESNMPKEEAQPKFTPKERESQTITQNAGKNLKTTFVLTKKEAPVSSPEEKIISPSSPESLPDTSEKKLSTDLTPKEIVGKPATEREPTSAPGEKPKIDPRKNQPENETLESPKTISTPIINESKKSFTQTSQLIPDNQPKEEILSTDPFDPDKKRRKRRRRKKRTDLPVRPDTQIDNTAKNEPVKMAPKNPQKVREDITLEDLRAGNEIEFNLD